MIAIPLVDLQAAHAEVAEEVAVGFKRVLADTAFIGGPEVAAFEREYAAFAGVDHCVGVANGTDALELALRAVGVGPGTEVILPTNTFIATAEAVARAGARPVLVDCDPDSYLIDVDAALAAITPATRAIVPVHLYGQLAPVERLRDGLAGRDVAIVEDAAQCQGATRHGRGAGVDGIAATSFYPGKNLGAYGDAGAVVTADADVATMVRTLGSHGGLQKYVHDVVGVNSRLDGLQAVVLRAKLARLTNWNTLRRAAAARYDALLESVDVVRPTTLRATSTSGTSTASGSPATAPRPAGTGCWRGSTRAASGRGSTTPCRCTAREPSPVSATRRGRSRTRSGSRPSCSRCRSTHRSPPSSRSPSSPR